MAIGGRRIESYYARGMLEIRPTLHLVYRLTVRLMQVLEFTGAASEQAGAWRWALPVFAVLDVAVWHVLRRSDRFGLAWRLPLDACDAAFWTLSPMPPNGQSDLAVMIAIPLAVEAGVRMGWRSMLVPLAVLASTTAAGAAVDKPVQVIGVMWVALGAVVGIAYYRYCRHLDARAEEERRRFLDAARRRAYLAGQNDVAMGASSAVDVIEGLVPVLGRPPSGSALWRLADGWKSELSSSTAQDAKYLQVAILEWERVHNAHPDLSGLAKVHVAEGDGTTLLSMRQATYLHQALDRMQLRGTVTVRRHDPGQAHLPGQELRIDVGDRSLVVPADRRASPSALDPAAVAFYYVASLAASWVLPPSGRVPAGWAAAGFVLCVVAGFVSHRRVVTLGRRARLGVYAGAIPVSIALTLLCAHPQAPLRPDGFPALAHGSSVLLLAFLGGFYWTSLGRWRWLVPAGVVVNVVIGVLVFPLPDALSARSVATSVIYNLFPFLPCMHLSMTLDRALGQHARTIEAVDEDAERDAFLEGRESVISLVRQARDDAVARLSSLGSALDGGRAELAAHRLDEVEQRLRRIDA